LNPVSSKNSLSYHGVAPERADDEQGKAEELPLCKPETDYLMECDWSPEQLNMIILYKYMKAFDN
jgi:hypothetical protein